MTLNPLDILALPGLANAAVQSVGSALDRLVPGSNSFADHLKKAQGDTDRLPVEIGRGVEVELSKEQLVRIAEAADRAEAEGATNAVAAKPFIDLLVSVRNDLRAAKQWALADKIRDQLGELGITLEDSRDGTTWSYSE